LGHLPLKLGEVGGQVKRGDNQDSSSAVLHGVYDVVRDFWGLETGLVR